MSDFKLQKWKPLGTLCYSCLVITCVLAKLKHTSIQTVDCTAKPLSRQLYLCYVGDLETVFASGVSKCDSNTIILPLTRKFKKCTFLRG